MRHSSTEMSRPWRSTVCLFLIVSFGNALDNNVTMNETSSKSTTDPTSKMSLGSTSELTKGSTMDTRSTTVSMAGSQTEFTALTDTKTTVLTTMQLFGKPSFNNKRKVRVALIINPLQENTKIAQSGARRKSKKAHTLVYQEIAEDGSIIHSFAMKNLDEVVTFLKINHDVEICHETCD